MDLEFFQLMGPILYVNIEAQFDSGELCCLVTALFRTIMNSNRDTFPCQDYNNNQFDIVKTA